jgi:drug/metabolite transporter (DMT)-like permease
MFQALLAAALFGASAPAAKLLLGEIDPVALAALLYLGCGAGVLLYKLYQRAAGAAADAEARISRGDWKWLAASVFAGGVAAPIILMISLRETPASIASLLLNFEGVATTMIAVLVFREAVSCYAVWAILLVTAASALLSWDTSGQWGLSLGALGVLTACVFWGIDNNAMRNVSAKDPLMTVIIKGLGAGSFSLLLALLVGNRLPPLGITLGALVLGSLSYGASIVLFIRALRALGAARTSALFGTAPLIGAALSFLLFRERLTLAFAAAVPMMGVAAWLLFREQHSHTHVHEAITHDHRHRHDDGHHNHNHPGMADRSLTHSHVHTHERLEHEHPHLPDIHHRHTHAHES